MAQVLVYYAHPGHKHSRANRQMLAEAQGVDRINVVDLYAEYPRFEVDVEREQQRLLDHDTIVFQFPMFWYSTPSLLKEWQDLVLEYDFAYGTKGDRLKGKQMLLAITAAGASSDYQGDGFQRYDIRTFLTPLEQTATLCQMAFLPPYLLFSSLHAAIDGRIEQHAIGYRRVLEALRDDRFDHSAVSDLPFFCSDRLPIVGGA